MKSLTLYGLYSTTEWNASLSWAIPYRLYLTMKLNHWYIMGYTPTIDNYHRDVTCRIMRRPPRARKCPNRLAHVDCTLHYKLNAVAVLGHMHSRAGMVPLYVVQCFSTESPTPRPTCKPNWVHRVAFVWHRVGHRMEPYPVTLKWFHS